MQSTTSIVYNKHMARRGRKSKEYRSSRVVNVAGVGALDFMTNKREDQWRENPADSFLGNGVNNLKIRADYYRRKIDGFKRKKYIDRSNSYKWRE